MDRIVISPKSKKELRTIKEVLLKINVSSRAISEDELEDMGLLAMMKDVDMNDKVTEEEVRIKLMESGKDKLRIINTSDYLSQQNNTQIS